nr:MFS transporter [Saprospiraceae bacterium]
IGLVTKSDKEHSAMMSTIEGVFMFGIALAYFLFPAFNNDLYPNSWLNVYWLLAALSLLSFIFLWTTPFEEQKENNDLNSNDFKQMFALMTKILVIVFVISAFLFVMIEQGIMTWLPTFNKEVIKLSTNVSIMMASILAISLGIGRLIAGILAKFIPVAYILIGCIFGAIALVVFVLPKTATLTSLNYEINSFTEIPLIAFAFPFVGLFIAPIYPLLNSTVLNSLPLTLHAPMTGLIVIFSALGGTIGSRIVGYTFREFGPQNGFYFTLFPLILLLICVFLLEKLRKKEG